MTTMRAWLATAAAALVVVAIVAGISAMVQSSQPVVEPPRPNPTALPTNSLSTGPAQLRDLTVPVYFLGDTGVGTRLFREFRRYQGVAGWSKLRVAVNGALLGDATDPDYRSGFPPGTTARVSRGPTTATVDLRGDVDLTEARPDADLALQTIVFTVDAVVGQAMPVEFRIDGTAAQTVLGVDTGRPLERADAQATQAPVWIVGPGNESTVGSPFTVTGLAATSEATVQWELQDGSRVVRRGFATADACCTTSPYSFRVRAPSGTYTLVVHDTDESGGSAISRDTKEISVR